MLLLYYKSMFTDQDPSNTSPELTFLSYGIGQDSWTILVKLALDPEFRRQYAPGRLVVIASDTGNEHPETMVHEEFSREFCRQYGIEYHFLTNDKGYHSDGWQTLQFFYKNNNAIGSKAYPKSCTDRLKIQPIYRFLEAYIEKNYAIPARRKSGLKAFAEKFGKIRVLIGIAKGEERRVGGEDPHVWQRLALEKVYPLIDIGYSRAECQAFLKSMAMPIPPPSQCMFCPFKSEIEVLWMARHMPEDLQEWISLEENKLSAWESRGIAPERNLGVFGLKRLPEVLQSAEQKYGHMTNSDLNDYRMSHGHLCANKF